MNSSLFTIQPYWLGHTWVFDALEVGLIADATSNSDRGWLCPTTLT
ncbi:MAG: hypothetical protein VKJ02_00880 [Snowella sp.]|nr:hypothetical protein [Snowella sp.]